LPNIVPSINSESTQIPSLKFELKQNEIK